MKNKLILFIILSLCTLALCACGGDSTDTGTSGECEHDWVEVDFVAPSCRTYGVNTYECQKCHKEDVVEFDPLGCDYEVEWEWTVTSDNLGTLDGTVDPDAYAHHSASAYFTCKRDSTHAPHISAVVKKETERATCQTEGIVRYVATIDFDKLYKDTVEYKTGLGECQNTYSFTLQGQSCTDGFDMESLCSVCQAKTHASFDSHVLFDMARFTVCGGEAVVNICPCGENVEFNEPNACEGEVELEEWTETDENGTVYNCEQRFCIRCDFEIIRKAHTTSEGCYSYRHRKTDIVDGEKVLFTFNEPKYEVVPFHELVYTYEGEKIDSCENGFVAESNCKLCGYTENINGNTHALKFDFQKIDLSEYGVCGGYLLIKKCPCETNCELSYSLFCDYEYSYEQGEQNGELHTVKTYTCKACEMEFVYDEYIKEAKVYGLYSLTVGGELKYELLLEFQ